MTKEELLAQGYATKSPREVGLWSMASEKTGWCVEMVAITGQFGALCAHAELRSARPLEMLRAHLGDAVWKRIA